MKKLTRYFVVLAFAAALNIFIAPVARVAAQEPNIVATLNFDPGVNGYSFPNYGKPPSNIKNELTAADMILLFGAKAVCISGETAQNCRVKAAAAKWLNEQTIAVQGGHCEGMAASVLRLKYGKDKVQDIQPPAMKVFDLKLDQSLGSYLAFYWVTQVLDEVAAARDASGEKSPVALVNTLIDAMTPIDEAGNVKELYTIGIFKSPGFLGGHAVTPIAVEDTDNAYRIQVYDNNYPGEIRYLTVEKGGKQTWKYVAQTNPDEPADLYTGDRDTKSLFLTPDSVREKPCHLSDFGGVAAQNQCRAALQSSEAASAELNDSFGNGLEARVKVKLKDQPEDKAEFFLNNDGDMLVTTADGKREGYDPKTNLFYKEIPRAISNAIVGGLGKNLPDYHIPFNAQGGDYTVTFAGKDLKKESTSDFTYSAPGFTVGFEGIRLDPNETLTTAISPNGETIKFTSSADGETPAIYYTFDPKDGSGASYEARVGGAQVEAGKTLTAFFDFEKLTLDFKDNDGNKDTYDVELTRINPDGSRQSLSEKISGDTGDNFELDIKDWDGGNTICVKEDNEGDGFDDDPCVFE